MADLIETPGWEAGIYQWETTDPVEGGPAGIDNVPTRQLANRTAYLKQLVEALDTGKQPLDGTLTALAALVLAADKMIYATGADAVATATLTAYARTLLAAVDAAAARTVLGAASPADIATAIANLVASSPAALDTLNELAAALGDDPNFATTITNALALKAPLASPALTGTPTAPTAAPGTATTQLASTAFVAAAVASAAIDSMVRLNTANGYGSISTKIRRFSNVVTNQGTDITYADSATLGASFTINTDGMYAIQFSENPVNPSHAGISLNTADPTISINAVPTAEVLAESFVANSSISVSWTGWLAAGSVVRAHTEGGVAAYIPNAQTFTIARVG